jgi:hypothetical protein
MLVGEHAFCDIEVLYLQPEKPKGKNHLVDRDVDGTLTEMALK